MNPILSRFLEQLSPSERQLVESLDSPLSIQAFLDRTRYRPEYSNLCPLNVLRTFQAHCLDGAVFAAAALRRLGYAPRLVDLFPEPGMDDDHVLAVFERHGLLGAVAKSNFTTLRYREPVYRTLRELVLSYFEGFFSIQRVKTLRYYTRMLDLSALDRYDWMCSDAGIDEVERRLLRLARRPLFPPEVSADFSPVDELSFQAGTLNAVAEGLYQPKISPDSV